MATIRFVQLKKNSAAIVPMWKIAIKTVVTQTRPDSVCARPMRTSPRAPGTDFTPDCVDAASLRTSLSIEGHRCAPSFMSCVVFLVVASCTIAILMQCEIQLPTLLLPGCAECLEWLEGC